MSNISNDIPGMDRRSFIQSAGACVAAAAMPAMANKPQEKNMSVNVDGYAWAEQIRSGDVTPLEALDAAIARVEALPRLNAVVIKDYELARSHWLASERLEPKFPTVKRNLSLYFYNKARDPEKALSYMEQAWALDQTDSRILLELSQLYQLTGKTDSFLLELFEAAYKDHKFLYHQLEHIESL